MIIAIWGIAIFSGEYVTIWVLNSPGILNYFTLVGLTALVSTYWPDRITSGLPVIDL